MKYKNKTTGEEVNARKTTGTTQYMGLIVPSDHWIIDGKPFSLSDEKFAAEYEQVKYVRPTEATGD